MKANSLCKNLECRKPFFACVSCAKKQDWRAVCCSTGCYVKYAGQVTALLARGERVDLLPDRTDMDKEQIRDILVKPQDEVDAIAMTELGEYADMADEVGVAPTVDFINEMMRNDADADNQDCTTYL